MSTVANTPYKDNNLASDYHRISGKYCYVTDIDLMPSGRKDNVDNMFFEYTYLNSKIEPIACIDFKMPGKGLSDKWSAIQAQIAISDKLEVPFFFAITYLDERYPVKCYYIIPINSLARSSYSPGWYSLKQYSKFQHKLRKLAWKATEAIDDRNLVAVQLAPGLTLGDLPDQVTAYPLPVFDFSWA